MNPQRKMFCDLEPEYFCSRAPQVLHCKYSEINTMSICIHLLFYIQHIDHTTVFFYDTYVRVTINSGLTIHAKFSKKSYFIGIGKSSSSCDILDKGLNPKDKNIRILLISKFYVILLFKMFQW